MNDDTSKPLSATRSRPVRNVKRKLVAFGRFLRQRRDSRPGLTQTVVSRSLKRDPSLVVHLEAGRITNPDKEMLEDIARIYELPMPAVVAAFAVSKYDIDVSRSSLMTLDCLTLDGLAEWEAFDGTGDLWIIAPTLIDATHRPLRNALITRIRSDRRTHVFLPESEYGVRGDYTELKHQLLKELDDSALLETYVIPHVLDVHSARWLRYHIVIANPLQILSTSSEIRKHAAGYVAFTREQGETDALFDAMVESETGLSERGVRGICLPMRTRDLQMQVEGVNEWLTETLHSSGTQTHSDPSQGVAAGRDASRLPPREGSLPEDDEEFQNEALARYHAYRCIRNEFKGATLKDLSSDATSTADGLMIYQGTPYAVQVLRVTQVADIDSLRGLVRDFVTHTASSGAALRGLVVLVYEHVRYMTREERERVVLALRLEPLALLRFYSM